MSNRTFFYKARQDASLITWRDVFSECRVKHSRTDFDYALLAGTSLDTASEETMLQKWRKPWLFYPMLKGGVVLVLLIYAIFLISIFAIDGQLLALLYMASIIPPLVMPIILLVFFWELNIPRNISIFEVFGMFILGALISLAMTAIMMLVVPDELPASFAPLREEPAKLIAAIILIAIFKQKRRIYGITGLVIGAAVGAGFGAFESVQYAIAMPTIDSMITNQIMRGVFALGGHTLYCAPYAAAIALNMKNNKFGLESFFNIPFILTFAASNALHFLWNTPLFDDFTLELFKYTGIIVILWIITLWVTRMCLHQIATVGAPPVTPMAYTPPTPAQPVYYASSRASSPRGKNISVRCVMGGIQSTAFTTSTGKAIMIGRDDECDVKFPPEAAGVSRHHCSIQYNYGTWTVKDLNSTYGTMLNGTYKVKPGAELKIHSGDRIFVGGPANVIEVTIT